jgi:hypothetical protein
MGPLLVVAHVRAHIKGSGHLIPIEEPVQLANEIAQFIAANT